MRAAFFGIGELLSTETRACRQIMAVAGTAFPTPPGNNLAMDIPPPSRSR